MKGLVILASLLFSGAVFAESPVAVKLDGSIFSCTEISNPFPKCICEIKGNDVVINVMSYDEITGEGKVERTLYVSHDGAQNPNAIGDCMQGIKNVQSVINLDGDLNKLWFRSSPKPSNLKRLCLIPQPLLFLRKMGRISNVQAPSHSMHAPPFLVRQQAHKVSQRETNRLNIDEPRVEGSVHQAQGRTRGEIKFSRCDVYLKFVGFRVF